MACNFGNAEVVAALLEGGANLNFATTLPRSRCPGFTPLIFATVANHAAVVELLLERGADGTSKTTTHTAVGIDVGSTALDIARIRASVNASCAKTFEVLRMRCCSMCGVTSSGLTAAGGALKLKRCGNCPAHYCGRECQRADWARHRGECRR